MKIFDICMFDENDYRIIERGFRWYCVGIEHFKSDEEEKSPQQKAIGRLRKGAGGQFTRPQLMESFGCWQWIREEMARRITQYRDIAEGKSNALNIYATATQGQVALIADPKRLAAEQALNLQYGLQEVDDILDLLRTAILAMKNPPSDEEFEDSEEYLNADINKTFVRR